MGTCISETIWSVYKITNIINNKIYIGQTQDYKNRWSRHKSDARLGKKHNYHLYNSMRKYGINNFVFEIIAQTKYVEEIDKLEINLIEQYKSTNKDIGYNNSPGGQTNKLVSTETRQKLSRSLKGRKGPMLGKSLSIETRHLISKANKGKKNRLGFKTSNETKKILSNINIGKKASKETKEKMSKSMIGKNKGEYNGMFGKKSKFAKLTQEQAEDIKSEYTAGNISMLDLSIKYNVSKRTIFNILHGKIYK